MFDQFIQEGCTIVMVTHDPGAAARSRRQLRLVNGEIQDSSSPSLATSEAA